MNKSELNSPEDEPLELKSVALFLAVAETGSMTTAGRRFGASQPAVSQSMARLEIRCGAALFERGVRPLRLTPAGEALRDSGPALLEAERSVRREISGAAEVERTSVRLGLVDSFAATVGPALVRQLRNHSERITVLSGISPTLWSDLQSRRLDFMVLTDPAGGVGVGAGGRAGGARARKLMSEPFVLLLPKRLAANISDPTLHDLAGNHPFIRYSMRSHIGTQIEEHLKSQGISARAIMEFDGTDALFGMVSAGLGWAITTPLCLVHGRAYADDLAALPLPGKAFSRTFHLVSGPDGAAAMTRRIAVEAGEVAKTIIENEVRPWMPWAADAMKVYD
ncbi:MAG: LysR family transcriptional regulator [Rhodospirillaceae bacterium]|nr:LysR family transcriptional regulator [Rhodospirillaceae bacterium]